MISLLLHYRYIIVIPIALFEGPLVMMICGFLLRMGYFSFVPVYLCLMAGDMLGDVLWYGAGYYFGEPFIRKFGKFFSITEEGVHIIENMFHKHKNKILIISKVTMGFGFAVVTLFTAGLVKIPFRRYLLLNFFGQFVWTGILMAVGYYLGEAYTGVNNVIGKVFFIAMMLVVLLALFGVGKYLKKRTIKAYSS